ncbi:exonuclease SbcCD subunit D [Neomicrococcus aestuarii]|uniref:Nuclease SbcCD subunit D n=1 Tax=Neomicrococcus aestuarii TaxID=556325 RepID=A0A1L2ZL24_9MICC|nr:exonuclease SbcCD subunit D [Neomicrococcus aestuarii]APF39887.1 exonuclease SbcCD subunit D [Neomicrococcus aestuarii]
MRFLHTSDWHLGRSFHGMDVIDHQRDFVQQVSEIIAEHQVDALLLSGDVYDRALPAVAVVEMFDEALSRLMGAGIPIIISSGNHDSAVRLGFGARAFEKAGVHIRASVEELNRPIVIPGPDFDALVYALPYLEPRLVAEQLGVQAPGHEPIIVAALDRVRQDLAERKSVTERAQVPLVMAHVFAAGGAPSESERELSVGGLDKVSHQVFSDFAYTALGHLHGRQTLAPNVRYSGSPLAYSFSEATHRKGAWLVDVDATGLVDVTEVQFKQPRALATLNGPIDDLLSNPAHAAAEEAFIQATVTDVDQPQRGMDRLRERFPGILVYRWEPSERREQRRYADRVRVQATPEEVCGEFYSHVRARELDASESAIMQDVLTHSLTAGAK